MSIKMILMTVMIKKKETTTRYLVLNVLIGIKSITVEFYIQLKISVKILLFSTLMTFFSDFALILCDKCCYRKVGRQTHKVQRIDIDIGYFQKVCL